MNLFFLLFLQLFIWITPSKGEDIDYTSLQSIEEVIRFETTEILHANLDNPESLSKMYLSRAESYLLSRNNDLAFIDFQKGYEIANQCDEETKKALNFRALFGLAIIYGCEEMSDELYATADSLKSILSSYKCDNNQETYNQLSCIARPHRVYAEKPIIGPDRISAQDCIDFAKGTARKCRILIAFVRKAEWKVVLYVLIDDLEDRAIGCCRAGGLWKSCLQPIVNKWQLWNEKWDVFGIPPDPAWD